MTVSSNKPLPVTRQPYLSGFSRIDLEVSQMSKADHEERGAIFTRREVVEFILDVAGYVSERPLFELSLLEPSFGNGDFLLVVVERLLEANRKAHRKHNVNKLGSSIRAVELHQASFYETRSKLKSQLCNEGFDPEDADGILAQWLICDDFLLTDLPLEFDFVVGNPPYVRHELVPDALMEEYRSLYSTVFDRADLYIPFIERSVRHLGSNGKLAIICADRWMKNRYGGPLRQFLAENYHLQVYVDMVDTKAFHSDVTAYPAIFVIDRNKSGTTRVARQTEVSRSSLSTLSDQILNQKHPVSSNNVREISGFAKGTQPWVLIPSDELALVRRLEREMPSIEETGCRIGIGVATGVDKVYIAPFNQLDVEEDRKLPLVQTRDIASGHVQWRGLGVVNPFEVDGSLVNLEEYPRLKRFFNMHEDEITKRHVAKKTPKNWYRTIDRIHAPLTTTPKLLIPDIKGDANVVYEEGRFYPHHNLYYVTASDWDLHALRAVLISGIAKLFVATYSTRMRGGYLRFQAQYLRRIRLPRWTDVSEKTQNALIRAADCGDIQSCNESVYNLYELTPQERGFMDFPAVGS